MLPTQKTKPKTGLASYSALIYGPGKIGKSTWCAEAEDALFLVTEPGHNSLSIFPVEIKSWEDMLAACAEIAKGNHQFKCVVLDTVDNAYRFCVDYICRKHKIEHESDLGYGKGHALVFNEFQRVLTKLAFLPYGLFIISHSTQKDIETKTGRYTKVVPTLPDKLQKFILGFVDMILFCDLETRKGEDGKPVHHRVMRTKPNVYYEAGDRTGRLPEVMPLDFAAFLKAFNASTKTKTKSA